MEWIAAGKVVKTIGLKGAVRIYAYAEDSSLREGHIVKIGHEIYEISKLYFSKGMPVTELSGIQRVEEAEKLLQKEIFVRREDIRLENDEYLVADLLGLLVLSEEGEEIGRLTQVLHPSSQDVYEITDNTGNPFLVPAVGAFIKEIDLVKRQMVVHMVEGLR